MTQTLARLEGIERRFGSVVALDGAQLELAEGEVHGVLGANGAGKSTLLNILGGLLRPDAGRVLIAGSEVQLRSPRDAWAHGIGLVHQHFTLVPALSVAENLALGHRGGDAERLTETIESVMERTGLRVPLEPLVETLGVGDRQRIEILKALLRDPRLLVLDEPTAVLAPEEVSGLFALLRELAGEGRAVVLVAHKLDEVLGVADRVTVLREGRTVLTTRPAERSMSDFVRAMVGDEEADPIALGIVDSLVTSPSPPGPLSAPRSAAAPDGPQSGTEADDSAVARLRSVGVVDERGPRLRDVSLEVGSGEIVGVAGVEGNGQRQLALVLSGRQTPDAGSVELPTGIGFVPQDRTREGLVRDFDLVENVALALHRQEAFRSGPWLRWDRLTEAAEEVRARYEVAAPSVRSRASDLSGGNQQRLIVGRELAMGTDLVVAENPTRGLDVAASAFVHAELGRLASNGVAIVLVSTDLDEVLALSHRVFVLARGHLTPVPDADRTREGVGALMLGGAPRRPAGG